MFHSGPTNDMSANAATEEIEVLIKGKWYKGSGSVAEGHLGIVIDEKKNDGMLSAIQDGTKEIPEGKRKVVVSKEGTTTKGLGISIKGGSENRYTRAHWELRISSKVLVVTQSFHNYIILVLYI